MPSLNISTFCHFTLYWINTLHQKFLAPHSSTLAWEIPWTEEPGGLQSMGSLRVGHNWATSLFTFHFHASEKEMATHSSVLARDEGAWWAAVYGVAQSRTHWRDLAAARFVINGLFIFFLFISQLKLNAFYYTINLPILQNSDLVEYIFKICTFV